MGWKQCVLPLGESCERIRDGFGLLAAKAGRTPEVALFSRTTADHCGHVLLLSPRAVDLAGEALSDRWTACDDATMHAWNLIQGDVRAHDHLGLRRTVLANPVLNPF